MTATVVTLVGLMGAGKTRVGQRAAEALGRPFVDTDELIARSAGMSVAEIFATEGEAAFRRREREAIVTALATPGAVVSVGGGAVLDTTNVTRMRAAGPVLWLYAEPSTLLYRLRRSLRRCDRPLLASGDPLEVLTTLLARRRPAYTAAASATLRTDGLSVERSAALLTDWIQTHMTSVNAETPTPITVGIDPPYDVWVGRGLLGRLQQYVPTTLGAGRAAVVTTAEVERPYGKAVVEALTSAGLDVHRRVVPSGEAAKSLTVLGGLYDWLASIPLARHDVVVALGGGVVTDLAGFLAATWHRGVPVVHLPTTLLAQVDAAIGGKTGVNLAAGKNLVGAFHQPAVVVADTAVLESLPPRELRAGLAEVIKCGFIRDPQILDLVERDPAAALDPAGAVLVDLVRRAVAVKAGVVAADTHEHGERALLNYGHTLGHAIETLTGYRRYRHGEAVALGMRFAAIVAELTGDAQAGLAARTTALLAGVGLPTTCVPLDGDAVWKVMARDKKVRDGIRMVLCDRPGSAHLVAAPAQPVLERALERLCGTADPNDLVGLREPPT